MKKDKEFDMNEDQENLKESNENISKRIIKNKYDHNVK